MPYFLFSKTSLNEPVMDDSITSPPRKDPKIESERVTNAIPRETNQSLRREVFYGRKNKNRCIMSFKNEKC